MKRHTTPPIQKLYLSHLSYTSYITFHLSYQHRISYVTAQRMGAATVIEFINSSNMIYILYLLYP